MLAHVIGECWHAFHRDVMALGRDVHDLSLAEMVSIVTAAPPSSSVRYYLDQGWSREAHLLATMQEQAAGVARLPDAYQRPGMEARRDDPMTEAKFFPADAMTWDEAERRDKARYAAAAAGKTGRRGRMRTY